MCLAWNAEEPGPFSQGAFQTALGHGYLLTPRLMVCIKRWGFAISRSQKNGMR